MVMIQFVVRLIISDKGHGTLLQNAFSKCIGTRSKFRLYIHLYIQVYINSASGYEGAQLLASGIW